MFFVCCNLLHLFVFTSSTTIITAFTPATHLNQLKHLSLSLKSSLNLFINHTNTISHFLLPPPTDALTQMQCHSSIHVCYDHTNPKSNHIINKFVHPHQYNLFHHQFNSLHIIQFIMHMSFNSSSTHHSHLVQFCINSSFISFSPIWQDLHRVLSSLVQNQSSSL